VPSLDAQIDELYQLPLSAFTSARNQLAKSLGGDAARRIRRLTKPTVVPWSVNQLYWRARPVYDRLLKTGRALREAQIAALTGRGGDPKKASSAHRSALADAVTHAVALAAPHGLRPGEDDLARTLEALSLAPSHPEEPGRLTQPLQPAGFEALVGVAPAGPVVRRHEPAATRKAAVNKAATSKKAADAAEEERRRALEEARRRAEAEVAAAERDLARARTREASARSALQDAEQATRDAERALAEARSRARLA
jgi:hypothetical protein